MEIDLINIRKSYNYQKVLKDINYSFKKNKVYFIVGESGCGKSTLIKIIAGIIKDYKGKVLYDGKNIKDIDEKYLRNNVITYIDQKSTLIEYLSLSQNIDFLLNKEEKKKDKKQFNKYSGGEKRRLATYVGSLKESEVIIADEISSSLDKENAIKIMDYLRKISKNKILIIVTHDKFLIEDNDEVIDLSNNVNKHNISNRRFKYKRKIKKTNYLNLFKYAYYKLLSKTKYVINFVSSFMVGLTLLLLIASLKDGIISFLNNELLKNFNFDYLLVENDKQFKYGFINEFNKISDEGILLLDDMNFDPIKNMIYTKSNDEIIYFVFDNRYKISTELYEKYNDYNIDINGFSIYINDVINEKGNIIHCPIRFFEDYYKFKGIQLNKFISKSCVLKVEKDLILKDFNLIQDYYSDYKFRNSGLESYVYINKMLNKIEFLLYIFIFISLIITFFLVLTIIRLDIDEDKDEISFMKNMGFTNNYIFLYYLITNYYRGFITFIITLISYYIVTTFSNNILKEQLGINYNILTIKINTITTILGLIIVIITISLFLANKRIKD